MSGQVLFQPLALSMFGLSWLTFFTAAVISFLAYIKINFDKMTLIKFLLHCLPREVWFHKSSRIDVVMYFASKILSRFYAFWFFIVMFGLARAIEGWLSGLFPAYVASEIGFAGVIGWSIVLFCVVDFANYMSHALQHFIPALWELHKVHHSAEHLNFATTKRMHPLGELFDATVSALMSAMPVGWVAFHYGLDLPRILILIANANTIGTIVVLDILRHSHLRVSFGWFDSIFLSPLMHQLHHSGLRHHWDKNFGNKLSIWEWAFGTGYKPELDENMVFGLMTPEEKEYHSLSGAYIKPVLKIGSLARANFAPVGLGPRPGFFWRRLDESHTTVSIPRDTSAEPGGRVRSTAACLEEPLHGLVLIGCDARTNP